jgi:anti-sigma factor RsiW
VRDGRWRITVTTPDWGSDHLSADAIVAFVDGELAAGPQERALRHLRECPECAAQVGAQGQARTAVRAAGCPGAPASLLSRLGSIPADTDLPEPPAGLAVDADGQLVCLLREEPAGPAADRRRRGLRLGTGVAVSGLALGALAFGAPAASTSAIGPAPERGLPGGSAAVDASLRLPVGRTAAAPLAPDVDAGLDALERSPAGAARHVR